MALLGDIRKRSWLLIIGIGLPLLAFLIGDAFSQGSIFGNPNEMGSTGSTPINVQDYNIAYNRISQNPQAEGLSENMKSEIAWNNLVNEKLILEQTEDLGITYNETKYFESAGMFYRTVNPSIVDENGRVNIDLTKQFLAELRASAQSGNPQAQYFYEQWENSNPTFNLLRQQYTELVSAGALATDIEAKFKYNTTASNIDINYVYIDYENYAKENKIEVADSDIESYMKANPKEFKPEATVNVAYAYFPSKASESDTAAILNELNSYLKPQIIKDEAAGTIDTIQAFANTKNDSIFVSRFSETPFDNQYYTKQQFEGISDTNLKNSLLKANKGDMIGPVLVGDIYQLIKISDAKSISDSAKTSHILIGFEGSSARAENITRTMEEAKTVADSLLAVIKNNPSKFNELASTISDDKVSAADKGSVGWVGRFQEGFAVPYRDFAVSNPKGTIELVLTEFGYHIIRIDDVKTKMGYQIAAIQKVLKASTETQEQLFNTANEMAIKSQNKSANDFINAARQVGAEVNNADGVTRFESNLVGLQDSKKEADVLKWAFNDDTVPGNIQTFETNDGGQVVAYLSQKFSENQYNVAAERERISPILRNKKIVEIIQNENKSADLNAIASKYKASVTKVSLNFSASNLAGIGSEPNVGGAAYGLAKGKTSDAIEGNKGVFYISVLDKKEAITKEDFSNDKSSIQMGYKQQLSTQIVSSLREIADVEDNRAKLLR